MKMNKNNEEVVNENQNDKINLKDYEKYFTNVIMQRGYEVYKQSKVKKVLKCEDKYYAIVESSNNFDEYYVELDLSDGSFVSDCNCPYGQACKHEYAVLIAISKGEYYEIELIKENNLKTKVINLDIIRKYVSDEVYNKKVLDLFKKHNIVDDEMIIAYFKYFLPEYNGSDFYARMYNKLYIRKELGIEYTIGIISNIISEARNCIESLLEYRQFDKVFDIAISFVKIIFEFDDMSKVMLNNFMYPIKVCYELSDEKIKKEIKKQIELILNYEHIDNIYLEYELKNIIK